MFNIAQVVSSLTVITLTFLVNTTPFSIFYFAPVECEVSSSECVSVCLPVGSQTHKIHLVQIFPNFPYVLPMAVVRSSSDGNAIAYIMYFRFMNDVMFSHNSANCELLESDIVLWNSPGGGTGATSAVSDCILL